MGHKGKEGRLRFKRCQWFIIKRWNQTPYDNNKTNFKYLQASFQGGVLDLQSPPMILRCITISMRIHKVHQYIYYPLGYRCFHKHSLCLCSPINSIHCSASELGRIFLITRKTNSRLAYLNWKRHKST